MATEAQPAEPGETHAGPLGIAVFPNAPQAPGDARRWVRALLPSLAELDRDTVDVLVSELVTNAHLHTEADEIWVEVTHVGNADDERVRVEVTDDGSGEWGESAADREGGRGLELVEMLSTRWGADHVGVTRVWFELKIAG